ncbi:MAG: hypothetical protein R3A45_06750 [Bdellovibrionota bacterium]
MKTVMFCLLLSVFAACSQKTPTSIANQRQLNQMTPNIAYVISSYEDAWETTLKIIQYDFLLPIEIQNKEKGFFYCNDQRVHR